MKTVINSSVKELNTFKVGASCDAVVYLEKEEDLFAIATSVCRPFYILGEGSNTLFIDDKAPAIIRPNLKGIKSIEEISPDNIDLSTAIIKAPLFLERSIKKKIKKLFVSS